MSDIQDRLQASFPLHYRSENILLLNADCMEVMKHISDGEFELSCVDPPYGGGCGAAIGGRFAKYDKLMRGGEKTWAGKKRSRFGGRFDKYKIEVERTGGTWAKKYGSKVKHWDIPPEKEYFDELARVSTNQIIWGGNYFPLPPTRCFLVWRKLTISENFSMAMCEYAWTSFNENAKWIEIAPQDKERFHATQKPIKLYEWILMNYAKPGQRILDTHLGSGSSAIAAHNLGFNFVGIEIDTDFYSMACKRLEQHKAQGLLFTSKEVIT